MWGVKPLSLSLSFCFDLRFRPMSCKFACASERPRWLDRANLWKRVHLVSVLLFGIPSPSLLSLTRVANSLKPCEFPGSRPGLVRLICLVLNFFYGASDLFLMMMSIYCIYLNHAIIVAVNENASKFES